MSATKACTPWYDDSQWKQLLRRILHGGLFSVTAVMNQNFLVLHLTHALHIAYRVVHHDVILTTGGIRFGRRVARLMHRDVIILH